MANKRQLACKISIICIISLLIFLIAGYRSSGSLTTEETLEGAKESIIENNPALFEEISVEDHSRSFELVGAIIAKNYNTVRIESRPQINSRNDLMDYKNQRLSLIDQLSKEDENTEVTAIINFKKLMTREEYLEFVGEYNDKMELIEIRFRSTPQEGNGELSVSNDQPLPTETTEQWEELLRKDGIHFEIATHIETLTAKIKAEDLKTIQNDPRVFLVDVGPVDVKEMYEQENNEVQMLWRYIFPEMERYGG